MKTLTSIILFLFSLQAITMAQSLQRVAPEQVGMDSRKLMYADEAIEEAIANKEIPGAVLAVVRNGKMAYLKAYGNKRIYPNTEPMTANTIFDMASCSKSMSTAICTMILAERGKIRLLDPVSRYIPGFKDWESEDGKDKKVIRITDLLTHSSGLPPYAPAAELEKKYGSPNPTGLMEYIAGCKRDFKPQTDFQYSCLNFITLQHIIEAVSGQSLRDFARENIFNVLGMNHTDYLPCQRDKNGQWVNTANSRLSTLDFQLTRVAPTEKQPNGQVLCGQVHDPLARILNGGISGNAGVFSCAEDIAILCAALQNGGEWNGRRILSPQGVKAMRTVPRLTAALGRSLGWDVFTAYASNSGDFFSPNTYGHTGYTGTSIVIDPDNDTSVILLINAVHPEDGHSVVRLRSLVANVVASSLYSSPRIYTDHYYKRFLQFMDEPAIGNKDIVMLGNSLTENGGDWAARLGNKNVRNRGIIGDEVMGVYDRLHQILPGHPAKLFLLIGVNDVSHDLTTDTIVGMIRVTVERIRKESPDTKLYLQSLLPINESFGRYKRLAGKTNMIPEINKQLEELAKEKGLTYINLFPLFTEKGSNVLRAELTTDGLHLKEEGYKIWVKAIRKKI
ncbi:serine hydrolase [Bacteroides clarus]|jgi:CubicO group peptidase (beta-lactamase class C family)/lysophospholipase L1-like esterase|uniref:serine hydrolase n=1 Tax=Bacteroides clarus TaxID=626929 RepID=UPI00266D4199|nr:serine hydrolase [Bacteroides clarus]